MTSTSITDGTPSVRGPVLPVTTEGYTPSPNGEGASTQQCRCIDDALDWEMKQELAMERFPLHGCEDYNS
jgi:hypothetical protein